MYTHAWVSLIYALWGGLNIAPCGCGAAIGISPRGQVLWSSAIVLSSSDLCFWDVLLSGGHCLWNCPLFSERRARRELLFLYVVLRGLEIGE